MEINGIPIKKYKAKVKNIIAFTTLQETVNTEPYKIVEGYVSIANVIVPYGLDIEKQEAQYSYVFVTEEISFNNMAFSGMGKAVYAPMIYDEFEIIGEVEE